MPVVASDLIAYSPANRPSDDVSTGGGAITALVRPIFTQLTAIDDLEVLSSSPSDTGVLTIVGRGTDGLLLTVNVTMAGTSVVPVPTLFERILSISFASAAAGTITIRRRDNGPMVAVIPAGEQALSALFKGAVGEAAQAVRYDKFFFKNIHGSLTLSSAVVRLTADPAAKIRIGLAATKDDTATITNRKTAPAGISFSDDNVDLAVPGNTLEAGAAIGVWVEQTAAAAEQAINSNFSVHITGTS